MKILYLEDAPEDILLLKNALKENRWEIRAASSCAAAQSELASFQPDIIISDIHLPDCHGLAWVSRLRQQGFTQPIVILTGEEDNAESVLAALKAGADDYFLKNEETYRRLPVFLSQISIKRKLLHAHQMPVIHLLYAIADPYLGKVCQDKIKKLAPYIHIEFTHSLRGLKNRLQNKQRYDLVLIEGDLPDATLLSITRNSCRLLKDSAIPWIVSGPPDSAELARLLIKEGAADYISRQENYCSILITTIEKVTATTWLKGKEEERQLSEARYYRLIENLPDIVYRYDLRPTMHLSYISPAVTAITGYTPEEILQNMGNILDLVHPDDRELLFHVFQSRASSQITRWIHKNGKTIWVEYRNVPVYGENGEIVAYEGIARDVTEAQKTKLALQKRLQELELLSQVSHIIISSTQTDAFVEKIITLLKQIFPSEGCCMVMLAPDQQSYSVHSALRKNAKCHARVFPISRGIIGRVLRTKQPARIPDVSQDPDYVATLEAIQSELCVPVMTHKKLYGAINIESRRKHAFSSHDEQLLTIIAEQIASGLEKLEILENERARRAEAESLRHITARLANTIELNDVLPAILDELQTMLSYTSASIWLKKGQYLYYAAQRGLSPQFKPGPIPIDETSLIGRVIKQQESLLVDDVTQNDRFRQWDIYSAPIRSWLGVPLVARGQTVGVIACDHTEPSAFSQETLQKAESIAYQATLAIERASLYQKALDSANKQITLHNVSQAILSNAPDPESLYTSIHFAVSQLMPCDAFTITLQENGGEALRAVYLVDGNTRYPPRLVNKQESLSAYIIQNRRPLLLHNIYAGEESYPLTHYGALQSTQSLIGVPIKIEQRILGAITVQSRHLNAYEEDDLRTLETLAAYIAIALKNYALLNELAQQLHESHTIRQLQSHFLQTLDMTTLLEETLRTLILLIHSADKGSILMLDEDESLRIRATYGYKTDLLGLSFPKGQGFAQKAISQKRSLIVSHLNSHHKVYTQDYVAEVRRIQSALAVPIQLHGKMLGVISLDSIHDPEAFSARDMQLAESITPMVALAIENARLFQEIRRSLHETQSVNRLLSITQRITRQDTSPEQAARLLGQEVREIFSAAGMAVYALDEDKNKWNLRHHLPQDAHILKNIPSDLLEAARASQNTVQKIQYHEHYLLMISPQYLPMPAVLLLARQDDFNPTDESLLQTITEIIINAQHQIALTRRTEQQLALLNSMQMINTTLLSSLSLDITFDIILDHLQNNLSPDAIMLWQANETLQTLTLFKHRGKIAHIATSLRYSVGFPGEIALIRTAKKLESEIPLEEAYRTGLPPHLKWHIGIPMLAKGTLKGVLTIHYQKKTPLSFEQEDYLKTLSGQAALAMENIDLLNQAQRSNQELFQTHETILQTWGEWLEKQGIDPPGHTHRVATLSIKLGRRLGLQGKDLLNIKRGAWLHDIGKIGIAESIWRKNGPLNAAEWEEVKKHPERALLFLQGLPYEREIRDIPLTHHENWDGSGYPRGLKGEAIPLAGRLFALVEVWDMLQSPRPYAPVWSWEQVLAYIKNQRGKKFDPRITDIFLKMIEEEHL